MVYFQARLNPFFDENARLLCSNIGPLHDCSGTWQHHILSANDPHEHEADAMQNVAPDGPVAFGLADIVDRRLRWAEMPAAELEQRASSF